MTVLTSQGELTREALTDAPEGQYLDTILQSYNDFRRNVTSVLQNGSNVADNSTSGEKQLLLKHNVEVAIANPLKVPVRGIIPVQCDGITLNTDGSPTSSNYALDMPTISWRPNPLSTNGGVLVKATFEPLSTSGYVGEAARSYVAFASRTALVNATAKTITSLSLTPGDWDISMVAGIGGGAMTGTALYASISTATNTLTADYCDNVVEFGVMPTALAGSYITIPSYRVSVSVTTTYYLVVQANFTVAASPGAWGRISATRVKPYATGITGKVNLFFYGG